MPSVLEIQTFSADRCGDNGFAVQESFCNFDFDAPAAEKGGNDDVYTVIKIRQVFYKAQKLHIRWGLFQQMLWWVSACKDERDITWLETWGDFLANELDRFDIGWMRE